MLSHVYKARKTTRLSIPDVLKRFLSPLKQPFSKQKLFHFIHTLAHLSIPQTVQNGFTMGSTTKTDNAIESLGNQALLDKIDRLRELNVGSIVSLPQLIVVGDQSSGKSSVLESLTGFSFPRATGLCTRYATQITCRREPKRSVSITIIPRPNANDIVKQRLRQFHRCLDELDAQDLADIFEDANCAMGIRSSAESVDDSNDGSITFSEDILKIEINGPDQPGLTVIDVPGIFHTPTPGLTTDSDITLVTSVSSFFIYNRNSPQK